VEPVLAGRLEFEMLYAIGNIDRCSCNARLLQCAIENLPCGTNERATSQVLLIPRLLADEHDPSIAWALPEYCLRRGAVQPAARAAVRFFAQLRQGILRHRIGWL
jgi:hypothetical protein